MLLGAGAWPGALYLFKANGSPLSHHSLSLSLCSEKKMFKCSLSAIRKYSSIRKHTEFLLWRKAAVQCGKTTSRCDQSLGCEDSHLSPGSLRSSQPCCSRGHRLAGWPPLREGHGCRGSWLRLAEMPSRQEDQPSVPVPSAPEEGPQTLRYCLNHPRLSAETVGEC